MIIIIIVQYIISIQDIAAMLFNIEINIYISDVQVVSNNIFTVVVGECYGMCYIIPIDMYEVIISTSQILAIYNYTIVNVC